MVQAERTRSVGFVIRPHLNIRICNPKYAHYKCLYSILLDCNHEVLATEREPEGPAKRSKSFKTQNKIKQVIFSFIAI